MDELLEDIAAEKEYISQTLIALEEALARQEKTIVELAAVATFLHNFYNGVENLLKRVLKFKRVSIPDSASWHKDLLDLAVDQHIITLDLSTTLDEYRAFRHFLCMDMESCWMKIGYYL
jgi:uncharacterized coiled-coil protein SlyX